MKSGKKIEGVVYGYDENHIYVLDSKNNTLIAVPKKEIVVTA